MPLISLAAGSVRDASRIEAITAAAAAGFTAVGLRFDLDPPSPSEITELAARLRDAGLGVLDVEVVRLSPNWDEALELRLIEWACALGARHLLVVSDDPDHARTVDGLGRVSQRCDEAGLSAVLEFMRFTHPSTLREAVALAREVGPPLGGVLVDALHLDRSGGRPEDLDAFTPALFPYFQLCDAPRNRSDADADALIHEARHGRLPPGTGALPLADLLDRVPAETPVSVEVQSDELERTTTPGARAQLLMSATRTLLEVPRSTIRPRPAGSTS